MIIAVVDDLLFGSKIRAAADAAGRPITFVRRGASAADAVAGKISGENPPDIFSPDILVIVDLGQPGAADAIREIRALAGPPVPVVAFASHVRADLIAEARAAGADRVLARSAFVAELPTLVAGSQAAR